MCTHVCSCSWRFERRYVELEIGDNFGRGTGQESLPTRFEVVEVLQTRAP